MLIRKFLVGASAIMALTTSGSMQAADPHAGMDHSKMSKMPAPEVKAGKLKSLKTVPASGKAREGSYDGRYAMEPTSNRATLARRCALASRGIIMLDNATWKRCGGKPKGAARGAGYYPAIPPWNKAGKGKAKEMDHSKMGH